MRYRSSKKLRKSPLTSSVSLEGFNNASDRPANNKNDHRKLSGLASLETLGGSTTSSRPQFKPHCEQHRGVDCRCELVKVELSTTLAAKNEEEERKLTASNGTSLSKSRRSIASDFGSSKFLASGRGPSDHLTEIKMYNTKTLPKRIANIKKQRAKTAAKETFKFYMDFPTETEETATVLRITESIENLSVDEKSKEEAKKEKKGGVLKEAQQDSVDSKEAVEVNDVSIISDLLKDKQVEFERILKKPPKKKSFDNGKIDAPLLAIPEFKANPVMDSKATDEKNVPICEPIYESLLRNVHVPYKFSPILRRSISHQHYRFRKPAAPLPSEDGPDSDYVTLEYTEAGQLKSVDGFKVMGKRSSMMRNSDSNINYGNGNSASAAAIEEQRFEEHNEAGDTFMRQSSLGLMTTSSPNPFESTTKISSSMTQLQHRKSMDCSHRKKIGRISNRRVSDASDGRLHRVMHKQGSESLGSRIAHLDYADPRSLFTSASHGNILINRQSIQRADKKSTVYSEPTFFPLGDSFYEQSVEDLLENDEPITVTARTSDPLCVSPKPVIPAKPSNLPPPLPAKTYKEPKGNNITPPTMSPKQSWVHKQIKNFEA